MRAVWIAVVILAMTLLSECQQLRKLISHDSKKRQNRHQLLAHPFGDELSPAEEQSSSEAEQKQTDNKKQGGDDHQKSGRESQDLEPQWHIYFIAMIIGTLVGMKILNVWEERINQRCDSRHKPIKKANFEEYFQNEFEEQISLASLP